jgi:hypothetical protein
MKDYWIERWKREDTAFHQDEINPYLRQYWQELHLPPASAIERSGKSEVFVPLCGKSRDMLWLRDQGYSVLGVELSPVAVQAFLRKMVTHRVMLPVKNSISSTDPTRLTAGKPMAYASCAAIFST